MSPNRPTIRPWPPQKPALPVSLQPAITRLPPSKPSNKRKTASSRPKPITELRKPGLSKSRQRVLALSPPWPMFSRSAPRWHRLNSILAIPGSSRPVNGEVNKNVVVGMNVQQGQQLLTIVPLDDVWITANFKETQLKHMHPGQIVDLTVDSSGRTYRGHIDSIGGATGPLFSLLPPENATGNYVKIVQRIPVKIVLDPGQNSDRQLRPGMSVEPRVRLR